MSSNSSESKRTSFTLQELMDRINTIIPIIDSMLPDLGSAKPTYFAIRKNLIIIGKQIREFESDLKISDEILVKQFSDISEKKFEALIKLDLSGFKDRLAEITGTPSRKPPVTLSAPDMPVERKRQPEVPKHKPSDRSKPDTK